MEEIIKGYKAVIEKGKYVIKDIEIIGFGKSNFFKIHSTTEKGDNFTFAVFARKFEKTPNCSIGKVVLYSTDKIKIEEMCKDYLKKLAEEYLPKKLEQNKKEAEKIKKIMEELNVN